VIPCRGADTTPGREERDQIGHVWITECTVEGEIRGNGADGGDKECEQEASQTSKKTFCSRAFKPTSLPPIPPFIKQLAQPAAEATNRPPTTTKVFPWTGLPSILHFKLGVTCEVVIWWGKQGQLGWFPSHHRQFCRLH